MCSRMLYALVVAAGCTGRADEPTLAASRVDGSFETTDAPACPELRGDVGVPLVSTTFGRPDLYTPSCGGSNGSDRTVSYVAPADGRYVFTVTGPTRFDSLLAVFDGCDGAEIACDDGPGFGGELVEMALVAGQEVVVVVDGATPRSGTFELVVRQLADEEHCDLWGLHTAVASCDALTPALSPRERG